MRGKIWFKLRCNAQHEQNQTRLCFRRGHVLVFKKGMRGYISYASKRYNKTNNKHLTSYDPKKTEKYITYWTKIIHMIMLC